MPGRHGSGPMGGGFRGGGMPGGGFGGGWGGGWRPRGPWLGGGWGGGWGGYGYRRPFWGGFPWIPFMGYGGGWGYGGGCGGIGCLGLIGIFFCIIVFSSAFGGGYRTNGYYRGNTNSNSNTNYSYSDPQLSNESGPVQTQTAVDLTELHQAFDSRIPGWMNELSSNQEKSIPPADAGLSQDNNTRAVIYGKCGTAFYVYVVDKDKPDGVPADSEGYVYTTASSPGACHPAEYTVYQSEDVGGGWSFVYLQSVNN